MWPTSPCAPCTSIGYAIVGRHDPRLRGLVVRLATTMLPAASLLVLAGVLHGVPRALCWIAALVVDYGGLPLRGTQRQRDLAAAWRTSPSATG